MAVWQGSEQGQQSAEQAACERRSSCTGRLAVHSQGRSGQVVGLEGYDPSRVPSGYRSRCGMDCPGQWARAVPVAGGAVLSAVCMLDHYDLCLCSDHSFSIRGLKYTGALDHAAAFSCIVCAVASVSWGNNSPPLKSEQ